eukprot:CAMPEP_0119135812 /NCGR_PEP_ID=MMETSP1310-20130426/20116_1 /TAXON_ID=464262 /ORGANISM="Genus nov. species nov., Strain RCC2339" /LENGTH=209 /DNA_ID=CAMNT_0007126749 /DNA_START=66 /DNA_END=692 /DNA_ORIENTATION=+
MEEIFAFHITGFGKFCGVENNPSAELVSRLEKDRSSFEKTLGAHYDTNIIPVSTIDVQNYMLEDCIRDAKVQRSSSNCTDVWVHVGVHGSTDVFNLEEVGWNEADFRCPDERGFQPEKQPIWDGRDCSHSLRTSLPLGEILESLHDGEKETKVIAKLSTDAGRFLCNFIYYLQLQRVSQLREELGRHAHALFVHIPPAKAVPVDQQYLW